jgi:transcriptional regulator with XRE-family HTH domain
MSETDVGKTFDKAFGVAFGERRKQEDTTQATVAKVARRFGLDWKAVTVTQLERGYRRWKPVEVILAALILELAEGVGGSDASPPTLPGLLREMGPPFSRFDGLAQGTVTGLDLDHAYIVTDVDIDEFLTGDPARANETDETERNVASRLGVTSERLTFTARRLWNRSLTDERDQRVTQRVGLTARQTQAVRGHVTRALIEELRTELERSAGKRPRTLRA